MNTNSTFSIGKDHVVCQDYTTSGIVGQSPYAIVCDGCSASPEVDFGARVLALSAKRIFKEHYPQLDFEKDPLELGLKTIFNAFQIRSVLPDIHPQALDATLLMTWVKDNKATAYLYGDGVFVHKSGNDVYAVHVHLTSGAPDYLSYYLDSERIKAYRTVPENVKEVWATSGMVEPDHYTPFTPVVINREVKEGDIVAVISDGINSFRKADNTAIDWLDLVPEFTGYKTFEGEFVLRRIAAFKRKCLKEGITHSDDISVSAIVV